MFNAAQIGLHCEYCIEIHLSKDESSFNQAFGSFFLFFLILQTLVDFEDHLLEIELTLRYYVFVILRRHRMSIIVIFGCSFYVADCELNQWWKVHKMHR